MVERRRALILFSMVLWSESLNFLNRARSSAQSVITCGSLPDAVSSASSQPTRKYAKYCIVNSCFNAGSLAAVAASAACEAAFINRTTACSASSARKFTGARISNNPTSGNSKLGNFIGFLRARANANGVLHRVWARFPQVRTFRISSSKSDQRRPLAECLRSETLVLRNVCSLLQGSVPSVFLIQQLVFEDRRFVSMRLGIAAKHREQRRSISRI
jgi:hypothetical protein